MSGFGDDGLGDEGDDWELICNERADYGPTKKAGEDVTGKDLFHLKHMDSGCMLTSDSSAKFTNQNCYRCVIVGHMEVSCIPHSKQKTTLWSIDSGFFFPTREDEVKEDDEDEESEGKGSSSYNDEL